jgi:arylsulfatase A-like enzyme
MSLPLTLVQPTATSLCLLLVLAACGQGELAAPAASRPPNLLVIIADDVGTDRVGVYPEGAGQVRTPNVDRLGREGLVFDRFWAMPVCSPTRASLLTGLYPSRTGIGTVVVPKARGPGLSTELETLPRALAPAGYTSVIVGKWHLANLAQGRDHPLKVGFAHHRGSLGNLADTSGIGTFSRWAKTIDGRVERSTTYATTDTVNDAIEFAGTLPEPWLLVVSFNVAHRPLHMPPGHLHGYDEPPEGTDRGPWLFRAMVESMDTEIGRLLEATRERQPVVFFLGDNGTEAGSLPLGDPRRSRSKGSLYESGIRVPFVIHHSSIREPGRRVEALASVTDLFATLVELAGIDRPPETLPPDSLSLVPYMRRPEQLATREWMASEKFSPNAPFERRSQARAIRDDRYKLIRLVSGRKEFYDLALDPGERSPLPLHSLPERLARRYRDLEDLMQELPPVYRGRGPAPPSRSEAGRAVRQGAGR